MDHEIDILNRDAFIDNLIQIVDKLSQQKQGITFAIDGGWGYGKTFVLQKFKKRIENEKKKSYIVLYYNCWEYDYYEEPLIAFTAALQDMIAEKKDLFSPAMQKKIIAVSSYFRYWIGAIPSQVLEHFTGVNPHKTHTEAKAALEKTVAKRSTFDKYSNLKQAILRVQTLLRDIQKKHPLIILIDEIDRCLPPYQIKILERFHHLFQIENTISIFSVNRSQLEETVKQLYGGDKERVNQYLKKFMSFSLSLDAGNPNERVNEKFADCLELFDAKLFEGRFDLKDYLYSISPDMDIREREKLWEKLKLLHSLAFSRSVGYDILAYELLWLVMQKYKDAYYQRPPMTINDSLEIPQISGAELMKPFCKGMVPSDKKDEAPCIPQYVSNFFYKLANQHISTKRVPLYETIIFGLDCDSSIYMFLLAYWIQSSESEIKCCFDNKGPLLSNRYTKAMYEQNLADLKKFRALSETLLP